MWIQYSKFSIRVNDTWVQLYQGTKFKVTAQSTALLVRYECSYTTHISGYVRHLVQISRGTY
eukprot:SAG11_NODE_27267_length_334_cov_3.251064_1_plen_61_part_01